MVLRICILANSARYVWNFRTNLMKALRAEGHAVIALSPDGPEVSLIKDSGFRHVCLPLVPNSTHPVKELRTVLALRRLLRDEAVDVVLTSTPKGNIYTALANYGTQRHQIANVSGLGSSYLRKDWLSRIVDMLYSVSFGHIHHVLFENPTDHGEFLRRGWVDAECASVIPGLGVDLTHFAPQPWPVEHESGTVRFLMIARLIGDKGVREYVAAAHQVRAIWPQARFELLGDSAADNPTSIKPEELDAWQARGDIVHYEHTRDVRPHIKRAHCIVLPSYREGMSRTLLEGGAMGRPLIASNVPGCREAIEVGVNGFLCEARSVTSLAEAITQFLILESDQQKAMGEASRHKIAAEFSEQVVIQHYISLVANLH
ncbi:MAG: glycosyltransferase family 4 protein [Magnetococcus sp. YQC-9]